MHIGGPLVVPAPVALVPEGARDDGSTPSCPVPALSSASKRSAVDGAGALRLRGDCGAWTVVWPVRDRRIGRMAKSRSATELVHRPLGQHQILNRCRDQAPKRGLGVASSVHVNRSPLGHGRRAVPAVKHLGKLGYALRSPDYRFQPVWRCGQRSPAGYRGECRIVEACTHGIVSRGLLNVDIKPKYAALWRAEPVKLSRNHYVIAMVSYLQIPI